ncbi:hypothetical protein A2696_02050 [Candidatus Curtissbacteria bacterium RIFCSPHIGHO2_01_FULL_41_13]|uniref:3-oxoacyl-ACP synthase n=1 Tax=Candidatus Curtissbacteria bacterium RIFCSPHIGHO2_01_FULL_41_13 TaxID=1797745 RepID=A0A1F5FY24_9BACT|nr:MAG: hypothetical protein A2696_02050 [Candidatus Curtissbacteria bacterium RIFCSPHIGHO2_01_FULL_41_13]
MSTERRVEITGLGKSRGPLNITREQAAQNLAQASKDSERPTPAAVFARLMRRVGINERGWLLEGEGASHLGTIAVKQAMEMAGITIRDVKVMIVATGLPDYLGVPTGTIIANELGGNKKLATMDVSGACPGFIHGLRVVYESMTSPEGYGNPQICVAAEPASKGINPKVPETYVLFGDASGAFVMDLVNVDTSYPKFTFDYGIKPEYLYDLYVPAGGSRKRVDEEVLQNNLDCIVMNGEVVKEVAISCMCEIAESVLAKAKLTFGDIDLFIPHQANLEIIRAVGKKLGISENKVFVNIDRYGNTSAATVPVGVREAWEQGKVKRGNIILGVTFGAGLNYAGAVIPTNGLPDKNEFSV